MGKMLCCCSKSPTTEYRDVNQLQERKGKKSRSESRLSATFPAPSSDSSLEGRDSFARSQRASQRSNERYSIVTDGATCNPKLECFIIPSFGREPPTNVARKKASSHFLKGVGDDMKVIQGFIEKDYQKDLVNVTIMCHFEQVKLASFTRIIEDRMKDLKLKSANKGLLIWYTGHGERGTGNWVLEDGYLTFEDIYNLYKRFFKGRYLYIVTDCCYSGSWVEKCADLLDRDGIKCGHEAKHDQIYFKVFASCLPTEGAYDKFYTECSGVKLHANGAHRTIAFAEHRKLTYKSEDGSQTTLGVDFTQTDKCILDEDGKCIHRPTWAKFVQQLTEEDCSKNYLI